MRKLVVGTGVGVLAAAVAAGGNRGYKVRYKGGYFPVPPVDHFADIRDAIVKNLEASGLSVERAHHEVGTAGQAEINYVYATMLKAGDNLQKYKYIVKNTAWAAGKTATFMPPRREPDLRRQRLRHACSLLSLERGRASVLRRGRLRRLV